MVISLCYVEGISRIDTPYFSSLQEQQDYFDDKVELDIETSYYPPHYANSIRISVDDATFNTSINYLFFEYLNKRYYYFIDSVDYINENLIQVNVIMDYIQTYMFNIEVMNGLIERKFINRWTDDSGDTINRAYIRENISNGEFDFDKIMSDTNTEYWIIIKMKKRISAIIPSSTPPIHFVVHYDDAPIESRFSYDTSPNSVNDDFISTPYYYYFMPVGCERYDYGSRTNVTTFGYMDEIIKSPYTEDVFIVPYNPVPYFATYNKNAKHVYINTNNSLNTTIDSMCIEFMGIFTCFKEETTPGLANVKTCYLGTPRYHSVITLRNHLDINTNIQEEYSSLYMPVLWDENYYRVEFGCYTTNVSFPLHELETLSFIEFSDICIDNGFVGYEIHPYHAGIINRGLSQFHFSTYDVDTNTSHYELVNDAWKEYIANNRNRLLTAGIKSALNITSKFIGMGGVASYANDKIKAIKSLPASKLLDKRYKQPTMKQKHQNAIERYQNIITDKQNDTIGDIIGSQGGIIEEVGNMFNAQHQPSSPKQAGTFDINILLNYSLPFTRCYKVRDYEQCAQYYHRNGYRVDEYIEKFDINNNIFDYINTRYYFNVLKMSICDIHLKNCIEDEETIENIKDRLIDGIRLWNTENISIGNFAYDNVEKEYLQEE